MKTREPSRWFTPNGNLPPPGYQADK